MRTIVRSAVQGMIRLYPLFSGGGAIAHTRLPRALTRERELVQTSLRNGSKILVYVNDPLGRTVYYTGDYDPRVTWVLRRVLRPGDCLLDIGANMGVLSLYAAGIVGPSGMVHAFEPQRDLVDSMRRSAAMNGYGHLHVHALALSDRDGEFELHIDSRMTVTASLEDGQMSGGTTERVAVRRTQDYLRGLALPPIRLLKIDVERHEEAVLRGAGDFFTTNRPSVILFESLDEPTPFWERGAVRMISSLGFDLYQIGKPLLRMSLTPVRPGVAPEGRYYDYVGIDRSRAGDDARRRLGASVIEAV